MNDNIYLGVSRETRNEVKDLLATTDDYIMNKLMLIRIPAYKPNEIIPLMQFIKNTWRKNEYKILECNKSQSFMDREAYIIVHDVLANYFGQIKINILEIGSGNGNSSTVLTQGICPSDMICVKNDIICRDTKHVLPPIISKLKLCINNIIKSDPFNDDNTIHKLFADEAVIKFGKDSNALLLLQPPPNYTYVDFVAIFEWNKLHANDESYIIFVGDIGTFDGTNGIDKYLEMSGWNLNIRCKLLSYHLSNVEIIKSLYIYSHQKKELLELDKINEVMEYWKTNHPEELNE